MILHTLVHLGDSPTIPFWVRLGILLARGVILLPARGLGSRTIRLPMRARRLHIANTGTISRMTRNIFVMLLWLFCWTTSWECFLPPPILGPAFSQTISRLRGCQYSGWVVHDLQASVTDDQERKLLSNPLFHRKDLLAPTTIEATLQAAGKVVHLGDGPTITIRVRLGILLARGGILLHTRRLGSRTNHLPMDDSLLLLLLVLLCLGDDHKFLHLSSLPQIRPAAHFTKGGWLSSPLFRRLAYQSGFRLMMSANPLRFFYCRTTGRVTWGLSPCPIGAVPWLLHVQVPSRLQALGPAFTRWITANNSSSYGRFSSAILLHPDDQECHEETCLNASLELLLDYLYASFQPPPGPSPGFSLGYQTKIHLVMAAIRLQSSCTWTKRRATWWLVALLPWQCCLSTCQQAYSRPQAIGPALLMTISSLLGCGLCTGVLLEVFRYLLPGDGTAPASKSDCDVGRESPQDYGGVFVHPRTPQLLSGVVFWATLRLLLFW